MYLAATDLVARGGSHGPRFIFPLLLVFLLLLFGGWFIRQRRSGRPGHGGPDSPMQTLQNRFARGEIDRAEFEHRKAVLLGEDEVPPIPERPVTPSAPTPPNPPSFEPENAAHAEEAEEGQEDE